MNPSPFMNESVSGVDHPGGMGGPGQSLQRRFQRLARQWKRSHVFSSSTSQIALDPAYQQIIGMGYPAVPLVLRELEKRPDHWFWALRSITGEDPVLEDQRGNLHQMTAAWLKWGRERGYLA